MVKPVLVHGVTLAVGLAIGAALFRTPASDLPAHEPKMRVSTSDASSASLDASQMRAMLREELGAALTSAFTHANDNHQSAPASIPVLAPVTVSPQQQQEAMQAANDIIAGGQWGDGERIRFHQQLAQLDPVQREQAMQNLVQAIDSGSLKVATEGPPI